jgi:hypothetical protein
MTSIDSALAQALGLPLSRVSFVNLPAHGGMTIASVSDADLTVVHPSGDPRDDWVVRDLLVVELALAGLGYQVLIGRDVLAMSRFVYDGRGNRFSLDY